MLEPLVEYRIKVIQNCQDLPGFTLNDTKPLSSASFPPEIINPLTVTQPGIMEKVFKGPKCRFRNKTCQQVWISLRTVCAVLFQKHA